MNSRNNNTTAFVIARIIVSLLAMIAATSTTHAAPAFLVPDDYRFVTAARKFDDTAQFAAAFRIAAPRALRAHHTELAIGTIFTNTDNRLFVSVGPVWRFPLRGPSTFVDVGFSPTLLSGSTFNGRELGGNIHFTSSLAIGARFGRQVDYSIAFRAQHISNGGINGTNPGLDMVGLTFAIDFHE